MIWKVKPEIEVISNFNKGTLVEHLGIEVIEIGDDFIKSRMPVDHRTKQPMGLLHGGASAVLSESMGSIAGWLTTGDVQRSVVGLEINANHLKSAKSGWVYGTTKPIRIGKSIQVWNTEIFDENDQFFKIIETMKTTEMVS